MPKRQNVVNINELATRSFQEQLKNWYIDETRAQELGLEPVIDESRMYVPPKAKGHVQVGIKIPYYDYDGEPIVEPRVTVEPDQRFVRYRYQFKSAQFGADLPCGKYSQEDGTRPFVYVPPLPSDQPTWREVVEDPTTTILITEGEMKAAMAASYGFKCLALGGVWSFRSVKWGVSFLPQLEEINWARRDVIVIYDADVARNPSVAAALNALAKELFDRGAKVEVALLPLELKHSETGEVLEKVGLDDFLVHAGGVEAFDNLPMVPMTAVEPLFKMNERYCFVTELNSIYDYRYNTIISATAIGNVFANVDYNHVFVHAGEVKMQPVNIGKAWMEWPLRNDCVSLTYEPGQETRLLGHNGKPLYNVWSGWGVEPKRGSVKPFMDLFNHVFADCSAEHRRWVLSWFAYPLQHPGAKLNQALVIHGPQGSGKTMVCDLMSRIYGDNAAVVVQDHLQSPFNEWMHGKQWIHGEEISGTGSSEHRRVADKLKHYVTGREISINRKNSNLYNLPNHCNFVFTSNHPDAFFIESTDRRFFVIETPPKRDDAFYDKIADWRDMGGVEALFHYLLNLDLSNYSPKHPAPETAAKRQMINTSRSALGAWLSDIVGQKEVMVGSAVCTSDLWTTKSLRVWYEAETDHKVSDQMIVKELQRLGAKQACNGRQIRLGVGYGKTRLWAIHNFSKWASAGEGECRDHYLAKFASASAVAEAMKTGHKKKSKQ